MQRITVKDMKKVLATLPDDTIVCMYSDSEGNAQSTAFCFDVDTVGEVHKIYDNLDKEYTFVGGSEIFGIDQEKDKGKTLLIMVPSL